MQIEFDPQIVEKYPNIKLHEKRFSVTDGQTVMTKLIVAFHNFANAPKIRITLYRYWKTGSADMVGWCLIFERM